MRIRHLFLALATTGALAGCGGATRSASPAPAPAAPAAAPAVAADAPLAPTGTTVDEGTFVLELQGSPVGRETFRVLKTTDGFALVSDTSLKVGAVEGTSATTLVTDKAWKPVEARIVVKAAAQEAHLRVTRGEDGLLVITTGEGAAAREQRTTRPTDLLLSNNTITHYAPFCALPAGEHGTKIVVPDTAIDYATATPFEVPGHHATVRELRAGESIRIRLFCEDGKLLGLDDTMNQLRAHREGDAALAALLAQKPRTKPPTPATVVELPRQVKAPAAAGVGDAVLDCTLLLPAAYAEVKDAKQARGKTPPLPAVVFITGSGPEDRDEDSPGPAGPRLAIFKVLAVALGEAGVASLRCDDLGVGQSTGDAKQATRHALVALVAAQVDALRHEPAIDGKRLGLIGHSEGGELAPLVATADPKLRALVLMAAPGRPIDAILLEQSERVLRQQGVSEAELTAELDRRRAIFAAWKKGEALPDSVPAAERPGWEAVEAWLKSYLDVDPAAVAKKLTRPAVLLAQGQLDQQVSVADAQLLEKAFRAGGNRKVVLKIYPELNHLFARTRTGDIREYTDPDAHVDPGFVADVVAFLVKVL